jgi:hypothetical protein
MKNNMIDSDDDFGFSAISVEEYEARIKKHAETAVDETSSEYEKRLQDLESLIIPFLEKLRDTGDKEYIFWPNRKPAIEKQIGKILKLTRG